MEQKRPLILGAAYHGNRMPHHAYEDLRDMMRNGMDLVVHMLSHTDWDRHLNKLKEIVTISTDVGLESWIDNWGLGGPPGDKSHFLAYHPEAHQYYSNGEMDPVRACLNSEAFRSWVHEWIDAVEYIGGRTIFWDEPHLPLKEAGGGRYSSVYTCACPHCRELFRARYGYEMPEEINKDVERFRLDTIRDYFEDVTRYSAAKGIRNVVCVMLGEHNGISLATLDSICGVIFWLSRTPPVIFSVLSLETDLNTAVGPFLSELWEGLQPSARGSFAFLPSGVAMVPMPCPTFALIEEVPP